MNAPDDWSDPGALLDGLFASAPLGLAFWDTELRYRRINELLASINGPSVDEHLGHQITDVLGELGIELAPVLRRVLDSGEPVIDLEVSGETPGAPGVKRTWLASYYPVSEVSGRRTGVGAVVREVTEQRRAETAGADLLQSAFSARTRAEAARAEAETARRQTEFLARAGARMMASTDFETALAEVARAAVPELADWCAITLVDQSGDLKPVAVAHQDPERERLAWDLSSRYPARADDPEGVPKAIRTGQTEHVPEIPDAMLVASAADDEHLRLLRELDLRAGLIVPLKTPDRTLGALTLVFAESDRRFTRDVMMLAEALAARAALAIENARLATERSHIARTLQDSLRPPRLPEIPMLDAAARYRAAGVQNEVGGDFYDVFETGSDTWTAILGDVSGKGPEAAAVTALARHTLWAAARREPSPIKNLELLNEALLGDDATESRFCTVVYARVCPAADGTEVTLSNAGHLPPLLLRADGTVEQVAGHGTLMGAVPDPEFALETLSLQPGELLLLYTDGVTEVRTTDLELGERRLRETLAGCVGKPAEEVVRLVEQAAVDLQEGEPRDDMALLALRAAPVAD